MEISTSGEYWRRIIIPEGYIKGRFQKWQINGNFNNPLSLAKDVVDWIEHTQPGRMIEQIDCNEKGRKIVTILGGNQEMCFITEDGLFEVLMQSRKLNVKKTLKRILKQIRHSPSAEKF